jgi:hypothetical protein
LPDDISLNKLIRPSNTHVCLRCRQRHAVMPM